MSGSNIVPADSLAGTAVHDLAGNPVGTVVGLLVDVGQGRIAHVLVRFEEVDDRGGTGQFFAIPWPALAHEIASTGLVVDVGGRLTRAPGFDAAEPPDFNDAAWQREVELAWGADESSGEQRRAEGVMRGLGED